MTTKPPAPPPHFVRSSRSPGGWAILMPYKAQHGDVVTVAKRAHRIVVRLKTFIDLRGMLWAYEKCGQINRDGKFILLGDAPQPLNPQTSNKCNKHKDCVLLPGHKGICMEDAVEGDA